MFESLEKLKKYGFEGFKSVKELNQNTGIIPKKPGIYLILNLDKSYPEFLITGTGGRFKNKNPNKKIDYLISKWVKSAFVIYIGKAGGSEYNSSLRSRIKMYLDFGNGKPVGHYGGRLIWQLKNSASLIVCWKEIDEDIPRNIEKQLISDFESLFGYKPFANINR